MKKIFPLLLLLLLPVFAFAGGHGDARSLEPIKFTSPIVRQLIDDELWVRRQDLLRGASASLNYLSTNQAEKNYDRFKQDEISIDVIRRSLKRFHLILRRSSSPDELYERLKDEFLLFRSVGVDGEGKVKFTGYFQPAYKASRVPTDEYRYPLFRLPPEYSSWRDKHPTRIALEGYEGTGNSESILNGLEIAWLKHRYEAFMIHVQGSAVLDLTDGTKTAVGYAGNTDYSFVGFVKSCLQNKPAGSSTRQFFLAHPGELNKCLARNNRFIFFKENAYPEPIGSLGVPVIAGRSIATDKRYMPPGAFALINTQMPYRKDDGSFVLRPTSRVVLDHDSGGAIKGPGRADIFMGTGPEAGQKARAIYSDGQLYYFILKKKRFDRPV